MEEQTDVVVIGSGIAGLTAACLLAKEGLKITVLEQNWLPGGCASSYPRKHYIFESGATTLVGMDPGMPLQFLLKQLDLEIPMIPLEVPMQVHFPDQALLTRFQDLDAWIAEAERVFGPAGQRPFWEYCFKISQKVWNTSLQQRAFPPSSVKDLIFAARNFTPTQLPFLRLSYSSMQDLLKKFHLLENERFVRFVNEQLLITAQNHIEQVNVPFGTTALCYTNYTNYYVEGGLINLVQPLVKYIEDQGGEVRLRTPVQTVQTKNEHYLTIAKNTLIRSKYVISAIPINNTLSVFLDEKISKKYQSRQMESAQLNSAFTMGLVFKPQKSFEALHHQIHLRSPLPYCGSSSIFLSLSHPNDPQRCGPGEQVGSISTHIPHPAETWIDQKEEVEAAILDELEYHGFLRREDLIFYHSSTPKAWEKWTRRAWGFVGGYPQYMSIKPWQMIDSRMDHHRAYICGDSTYPGQGIPGACLSGIVAWQKMKLDGIT